MVAEQTWKVFLERMEDIKSGKINCIIVKDLSRLGRNYIEMGKYLEQIFPMMGIRFIAINDNYDNANAESNDSDNIVVPFKNLLNDSYCRDISIKVRSQLDMKRRKGEFIGGYAIYGYCKDERNKNRLVVDEYGRKTHFIPNGVNRPQIREASLITDKFGLKKGSCQCHEPSCLIPICTKNSPSPCGNGEHKSYIIFSVYLTECTSQLNRWFSGGLRLTQTQPYIIPV